MDEDFDDEELLLVTGRGSKAAGKKRNRKADDSEDEDERPARQQKPAAKRRAAAADSEDSESDDDGMDAEERAKLQGMNELEREMYLFEREEILQRQRERQQVLTQVRKEAEQVEVRASSRRPRTQTGTDSAIGRIAAAHAQREERQKKKQQEEQQAERSRKKRQQQDEEDEEQEEEEEAEESDASLEAEDSDELQELEAEEEEEEEEAAAAERAAGQLGTRTEAYDEGAGSYEESEERASLDEVRSITLRRSNLEAWHNEPFFEEDVRGCLLRIVNSAEQARTGQPSYLLARISDIVSRNSYTFPAGAKASRTRKWLHMDDLSGSGVFRHQMSMVSNSEVTQAEYDKALGKAQRGHSKFITKGDVQQAQERLQHARNFKYNPELVKQLLDRKRAAGKGTGTVAERRARLTRELNIARQEGQSKEVIMRLQDELDRIEQQERQRTQQADAAIQAARADREAGMGAAAAVAAAGGAKLTTEMALAVINMRNRDKNVLKIFQGVGPSSGSKKEGTADVFSRRHTQSKVYWQTGKDKQGEPGKAAAAEGGAQLKGKQKTMEPSELIKVLNLDIDLSRLPPPGQVASALLPKRLLGPRWLQSVERRQQDMAGRSLLTLDDWRRKMSYTQQMME